MLHAVGYIAVLQDRWQGIIPVVDERVSACPLGQRLPFAHHPGEFERLVLRISKISVIIYEAMVLDVGMAFPECPLGMARGVWFFKKDRAAVWVDGLLDCFGRAAEWTM